MRQSLNLAPKVKTLVERWLLLVGDWHRHGYDTSLTDVRGPCQGTNEDPKTWFSQAMMASVRTGFEQGMSCTALARTHGVHKTTVMRRLRKAGSKQGGRRWRRQVIWWAKCGNWGSRGYRRGGSPRRSGCRSRRCIDFSKLVEERMGRELFQHHYRP